LSARKTTITIINLLYNILYCISS